MKIKIKTLREFEIISENSEVQPINCPVILRIRRWLRVYNFPKLINDISFEQFIQADKYKNNPSKASYFIGAITNYKATQLQKLPASKTLGAYNLYTKQFNDIYKMFQDQDDLISSSGKVKYDMIEFGLTNIISLLAGDNLKTYADLMTKSVSFIFVEYRRKIKKIENYNYNLPQTQTQ